MVYYYAYAHVRPDTGVIFNVGKGKGRRAWSTAVRNKHWHHVVNKNEGKFYVRILNWFNNEDDAYAAEIWQIAELRPFGHLVNVSDGGEGVRGECISGDKNPMRRPEVAAKARATSLAKGENHHSKKPDVRKRMSAAQKSLGENHPARKPENKIKNSIGVARAWSEKTEEEIKEIGKKISDRMSARSDEEKAITAERKSKSIKTALSERTSEEKQIQYAKLSKPVVNVVTGESFPSATSAAKHYGYPSPEWVAASCRYNAKGKIRKIRMDGYYFAFTGAPKA
jgi:hypothetical protein